MKIERNLGFELVRATEAAALRSARWMGIGGAPEAVVTACALKCVEGAIQCRR